MALLTKVNSVAPAQAMWGVHLFMPPGKSYDAVSSGTWDGKITLTNEIDAKQQETTEAQNPINKEDGDKQKSFTISVEVNKLATGQDPLTVHKFLCNSIGKKSYFFIGSIPIDTSYYFLKNVELRYSNIDIAPNGDPYRAEITLSFVEDVIMRVEQKNTQKPTQSSSGGQTASNVGASNDAKRAAQSIWE